jgi:hypothetical protein
LQAKDAYINISNKTLFTSASSAACGVHLEDDTAYLIMGTMQGIVAAQCLLYGLLKRFSVLYNLLLLLKN